MRRTKSEACTWCVALVVCKPIPNESIQCIYLSIQAPSFCCIRAAFYKIPVIHSSRHPSSNLAAGQQPIDPRGRRDIHGTARHSGEVLAVDEVEKLGLPVATVHKQDLGARA